MLFRSRCMSENIRKLCFVDDTCGRNSSRPPLGLFHVYGRNVNFITAVSLWAILFHVYNITADKHPNTKRLLQ